MVLYECFIAYALQYSSYNSIGIGMITVLHKTIILSPGLFSIGLIVLVPIVNDGASLEVGQNLPSTFGVVYEQGVGLCHTVHGMET